MRILHTVEFYSPNVGGAQEVVQQVSEQLVARGHTVTVATTRLPERALRSLKGVAIEEFSVSGNAVRGMTGEMKRYKEFLLSGDFDVMMNYAAQQWTADLAFSLLPRLEYGKVFAPCGFSGLFNGEYTNYFAEMPEVLRNYHRVVFHSESYRDRALAREHGITQCSLIPNGALEAEFAEPDMSFRRKYGIPDSVPLLLTVGTHTGFKGHALAIEAFRKARIGRAVLVIIGNSLGGNAGCLADCRRRTLKVTLLSLGRKRVLLLDVPRREVVAAYHAADLFVFGSNVECSPIVLFEAAASKTPFVTVSCGNAAEIADWTGGGIVIPTIHKPGGEVSAGPAVMASAIEDLLADRERLQRMAEHGHKAWRERFTWEKISLEYEKVYLEAKEAAK